MRTCVTGAILIAACTVITTTATAQSPADWARCRSVTDSLQRLSCYDGMMPASSATFSGDYAVMSLIDWKTDKASLKNKLIEVGGSAMPFADGALLSEQVGDVSPVWLDTTNVPRDQRRRLISCSPTCKVKVRGKGGSVMGQHGIIVDALQFD